MELNYLYNVVLTSFESRFTSFYHYNIEMGFGKEWPFIVNHLTRMLNVFGQLSRIHRSSVLRW